MNYLEQLIAPGCLVFDVGANRGEKAAQYLAAGAGRVVCCEPQPALAAHLRARFCTPTAPSYGRVVVEEVALSSGAGETEMLLCDQSDTISTLEPKWQHGRFAGHTWSKRCRVRTDTLDWLIAKYGRPHFTKVDTEGHEPAVLAGLTQRLPALSYEYAQEFRADAEVCAGVLLKLGMCEFNMGRFTDDELLLAHWADAPTVLSLIPRECGGDIYARAP